MSRLDRLERRSILGGAAAIITGLAGCSSNDGSSDTSTSSPTETVVFTDSSTQTETETATPEQTVFKGGGLDDFLAAVQAAAETDSGLLEIEPGTYQFEPLNQESAPGGYHVFMYDTRGVTIEGNGATFVFNEPTLGGLRFEFGRDLTIRNLNIDYEPVPFTQGDITAYDEASRTVEVEIDEGYQSLEHSMFSEAQRVWASIHTPDGSLIQGYQAEHPLFFSATRAGERRFELDLTDGSPIKGLQTGRRLTIVARNNQSALRFHDIDQLELENVNVWAANGAAFGTGGCTDPLHRNCTVAPPPETDRHIGPNADGFRVVGCVNSARIEDCRVESILDDAFVVQRNRTPVVEFLDDRTIDVSRWSVHAKPGDIFDVLSPTGVRKGTLPPVESLTAKFPTPMPRVKPKTLTFKEPIRDRVAVGDTIGNRETASQNFVVRNNTALNNRGKSLRIAARDGVVEDNQFEGASHNTVELECDTADHFIPNGPVEDVTVRNNTLVRSGLAWYAHSHPAAIRLHHLPHRKFNTEGRPHRDITIEDNTIRSCASIGISLQDTVGVSVSGNDLQDLNRLRYDDGGYGFQLGNVRSGELQKNQVKGTSDALSGFGIKSGSRDIMLAENTVTIDGETTAGSLE